MEIATVVASLRGFIRGHKTEFEALSSQGSHLLEIAGLVVASEHYGRNGYTTRVDNLFSGRFRVKTGSRGYPHNFSWFVCERDSQKFEIHSNLAVRGHYGKDDGIYVVDVGVIKSGAIGTLTEWRKNNSVLNENVETFLEAKKLVVYPMLIAQFIGIVHEIKPDFLAGKRPWGFVANNHFDPSLISIGHFHGTSASICSGLRKRRFWIGVLPHFDLSLAQLRADPLAPSPLN
jgi:hypothetical protein